MGISGGEKLEEQARLAYNLTQDLGEPDEKLLMLLQE